ncbi:MAG: hypothetical protein WCZ87_05385 [Thiohalobacteraceae bacterium]
MPHPQLLFVYNADTGLFNTVTDIAHKLLSPSTYSCNLCALTHGPFQVREEWVNFLETLEADCKFLHRDEFVKAHPGHADIPLPAVFAKTSVGPTILIDAARLRRCGSLAELKQLITDRLQNQTIPSDETGRS